MSKLAIAPETIDRYDLAMGSLSGLPDGMETKSATVEYIVPVIGKVETFTIKTIRHEVGKKKPKKVGEPEEPIFGFTTFLQVISSGRVVRLVLPPDVGDRVEQQRTSLIGRVRVRAARQAVQTRKDRGDVLGNPEALRKARRVPRKRKVKRSKK